MNYEEMIVVIKRELDAHVRVGSYQMCWCGWRSDEYAYEDHIAAIIAVRLHNK